MPKEFKKKRKYVASKNTSHKKNKIAAESKEESTPPLKRSDTSTAFTLKKLTGSFAIKDGRLTTSTVEKPKFKAPLIPKEIALAKANANFYIQRLTDRTPDFTEDDKITAEAKLMEIYEQIDKLKIEEVEPKNIAIIDSIRNTIEKFTKTTDLDLIFLKRLTGLEEAETEAVETDDENETQSAPFSSSFSGF